MWRDMMQWHGTEWDGMVVMWLWPSVVGCEVRLCDEGWSWHVLSWKMLWSTRPTSRHHAFVLQNTTTYYTAITILQTTISYKVLQCTTQYYTEILCTAKYYSVLLTTIVYNKKFSVLQTAGKVLLNTPHYKILPGTTKNALLHTTKYYSVLQSTTLNYNALLCTSKTTMYYEAILLLQNMPRVLLHTTKDYKAFLLTTKYCSVLLQRTTQYWRVVLSTTKNYSVI